MLNETQQLHSLFPIAHGEQIRTASAAADLRFSGTVPPYCPCIDGSAVPVPGGDGTHGWSDLRTTKRCFRRFLRQAQSLVGEEGITTDRNGIFWVHATGAVGTSLVTVQNAADIGKTKGIPESPRR